MIWKPTDCKGTEAEIYQIELIETWFLLLHKVWFSMIKMHIDPYTFLIFLWYFAAQYHFTCWHGHRSFNVLLLYCFKFFFKRHHKLDVVMSTYNIVLSYNVNRKYIDWCTLNNNEVEIVHLTCVNNIHYNSAHYINIRLRHYSVKDMFLKPKVTSQPADYSSETIRNVKCFIWPYSKYWHSTTNCAQAK